MLIQNICVKKTYQDKSGVEKSSWKQVGVLKTAKDGKMYIELFMYPSTAFYVFDQNEKTQNPSLHEVTEVPF